MKFNEFQRAYIEAKASLQRLEGGPNWPGLTVHDRAYALPVDWQDERYTAIIRAHRQHAHVSATIAVEIWHWHWRGGQDKALHDLDPPQLAALAEIMHTVRRWVRGEIDELPPSTDRDIRVFDGDVYKDEP